MSVRCVTWVFYESEATLGDRLVLLALADEADDSGGSCYPSMTTLAHKARVSESTARRAVVRLEAAGELLVLRPKVRGRGRHNRYTLAMGRDPDELAGMLGWPAPDLDPAVRAEWALDAGGVPPAGPDTEGSRIDTLSERPRTSVDNSAAGPENRRKGRDGDRKTAAQVNDDALTHRRAPALPRIETPAPAAPTPDRFVRGTAETDDGELIGANLDGPAADAHAGAARARDALRNARRARAPVGE